MSNVQLRQVCALLVAVRCALCWFVASLGACLMRSLSRLDGTGRCGSLPLPCALVLPSGRIPCPAPPPPFLVLDITQPPMRVLNCCACLVLNRCACLCAIQWNLDKNLFGGSPPLPRGARMAVRALCVFTGARLHTMQLRCVVCCLLPFAQFARSLHSARAHCVWLARPLHCIRLQLIALCLFVPLLKRRKSTTRRGAAPTRSRTPTTSIARPCLRCGRFVLSCVLVLAPLAGFCWCVVLAVTVRAALVR